jgi:hypothetical protein
VALFFGIHACCACKSAVAARKLGPVSRITKIVGIILGIALALVAGVFGLVIVAAVLVLAALFALLGKGRFKVTARSRARPADAPKPSTRYGGGDVIDVEATRVEKRPELK